MKHILGIALLLTTNIFAQKISNNCRYVADYECQLNYHMKKLNNDLNSNQLNSNIIANDYIDIADSIMDNTMFDGNKDYQANDYYQKALKIQENILGSMHPETLKTNIMIGRSYHFNEKYNEAIKYYLKGLNGDTKNISNELEFYYSELASAYVRLHDFDNGLKYYLKSEKCLKKYNIYDKFIHVNSSYVRIYKGISKIYEKKKMYPKAIEYVKKVLVLMSCKPTRHGLEELSIKLKNLNKLNSNSKK